MKGCDNQSIFGRVCRKLPDDVCAVIYKFTDQPIDDGGENALVCAEMYGKSAGLRTCDMHEQGVKRSMRGCLGKERAIAITQNHRQVILAREDLQP